MCCAVALTLISRAELTLVRRLASGTVLGLAADIGFIDFDYCIGTAAEWTRGLVHGFADAVAHEPSGLVGDAEHTVDLMGAHAFLAGRQHVGREQPLVERHL